MKRTPTIYFSPQVRTISLKGGAKFLTVSVDAGATISDVEELEWGEL